MPSRLQKTAYPHMPVLPYSSHANTARGAAVALAYKAEICDHPPLLSSEMCPSCCLRGFQKRLKFVVHWHCRSAAETEAKESSSGNGAEASLPQIDGDREARKAIAAKISAARALARKLFEEKQSTVSAAKMAAEQAMDEEEIDRSVTTFITSFSSLGR